MCEIQDKAEFLQRFHGPLRGLVGALFDKAEHDLLPYLEQEDGAANLLSELPNRIQPSEVSFPDPIPPANRSNPRRSWELFGLYYLNQGRFYEALAIFSALYEHMLAYQETTQERVHKGLPLVFMSDCHFGLGHPSHAKHHLMLTLCEDAISGRGKIVPKLTGIYFRLVWHYGLSHTQLEHYASECSQLFQDHAQEARFPEWCLQQLDRFWTVGHPSPKESSVYVANGKYVLSLLGKLGEGDGKALELLADYLVSAMPGCRTQMRRQSHSTDYDVVGVFEGQMNDFRSELGRYFVCECKDWSKPADFTTLAKFCRVLDSVKARFGILFSKMGISGERTTEYAERERLKVFQDRGVVIAVVTESDLRQVADGMNFITMLREKYEAVRLDLRRQPEE